MNINTKRGNLSAYGLACGYIEQSENGNNRVTLYRESCAYHVTCFNMYTGDKKWDCYDTLKEAQQAYKNLGGMLK